MPHTVVIFLMLVWLILDLGIYFLIWGNLVNFHSTISQFDSWTITIIQEPSYSNFAGIFLVWSFYDTDYL